MHINKSLILTIALLFSIMSYSQDIDIKKNNKGLIIFTFFNNTEKNIKIPNILWRTFNKKKNRLTGIIESYYIEMKGDTLVLNFNRKTPKYFKGRVNGKENNNLVVFSDINLKPNKTNTQQIKIDKFLFIRCKYIKFVYNNINYITCL